jgi:stage II sporulation protein D
VRFKFFEEELNKEFPIKKDLMVFGKGSGHGVGMSQWGAKYMASKGQKAENILKHFYRGVQIKPFRKDYL